ncbi:MAG: cytochrome b5 domain-containing protein [Erysipelotrichaceae bacterium]
MTKKLMTIAAIATLVFTLAACSATSAPKTPVTNNPSPTTQTPSPTTQTPTPTVKTFTLAQLAKYNGMNGQPAYIAVSGVVYDVTNAKGWNNGSHQGVSAGQDLTKAITQAPHGTSVLTGLPVVGKLV